MKNQLQKVSVTFFLTFTALCISGCPGELDDDFSISTMTICNIPAQIPVLVKNPNPLNKSYQWPNENTEYNPAYKLYLTASNTSDEDKPAAAQALVMLTPDMLEENGTYTVTFELRKPITNLRDRPDGSPNPYNPKNNGKNGHYIPELDPNDDLGPWSGTATFFSVLLSPQDVSVDGQNLIWIRASSKKSLNKDLKNCDWNSNLDVDFSKAIAKGELLSMDLEKKQKALFEDMVCRDPDIIIE